MTGLLGFEPAGEESVAQAERHPAQWEERRDPLEWRRNLGELEEHTGDELQDEIDGHDHGRGRARIRDEAGVGDAEQGAGRDADDQHGSEDGPVHKVHGERNAEQGNAEDEHEHGFDDGNEEAAHEFATEVRGGRQRR